MRITLHKGELSQADIEVTPMGSVHLVRIISVDPDCGDAHTDAAEPADARAIGALTLALLTYCNEHDIKVVS